MIQLQQIEKGYSAGSERVPVLTGADLSVDAGESVALTGESGCGKSTLLHLLAGFDRPDGGRIRVAGEDLGQLDDAELARFRRTTLGMVFQHFNLLEALSVEDNLRFPLRLLGRDDPDWRRLLVERLALGPLLKRFPDQLSGGQQQRVAIARALAHRPPLLLADEPTGSLDDTASAEVMQLLTTLVAEAGATLVLVTHSEAIAGWLGRRVQLVQGRVSEA